ncbi:hypothetical protein BDA99DRAFT_482215 [Phascolomyces articulosus]|uniref:Ceramide very long chain fatty acid hydroxylase n=1 Tax=Phascolomyces articulosus TaxID=60185 RepID=A0AAD5JZB9_9FUNG|nr:hypothetical protein BDA99DRAFT_482215 [Phascolomyces articulosus]
METIYSYEQVKKHNSRKSCWVIYKDKVYDMTPFVSLHPGGGQILLEHAGTDVTQVFEEGTEHVHSETAYELLDEHYIGDLETAENTTQQHQSMDQKAMKKSAAIKDEEKDVEFLNLYQPLFWQLWNRTFTKEVYLQQIHHPRYVSHYVRFFENPILDSLTYAAWYMVPLVWFPQGAYHIWQSIMTGSSLLGTLQGFLLGGFFFTFIEYTLHRFLFHLDEYLPDNSIWLLVHFGLHGVHHFMPMDRLRLVLPPSLSLPLSVPIVYSVHASISNLSTAHAVIAGIMITYACYDCFHYSLHHAAMIDPHTKEMKRYHLAHHYKNPASGYGITSKLWDHVFGTVLEV